MGSIGVIVFVFLAGYLPFDEPTMSALFRKIQKAEFEYPDWFSPDVIALLDKILVPDPKKRLTLQQIKQEEWYNRDGPYAQQADSVSSAGEGKEDQPVLHASPSDAEMDAAIA